MLYLDYWYLAFQIDDQMHYLDQSLLQPHVFGATQYELRLFLEL